jgi:hypothetical protein
MASSVASASGSSDRSSRRILMWSAAITIAALGTWIMFAAEPGLNWLIWTASAAAGLVLFLHPARGNRNLVIWLEIAAVVIAGGATVTADNFLDALICFFVILLLALSMLLSIDSRAERVTPGFTVVAPAAAFGLALAESVTRGAEALRLIHSSRTRAVVRGLAITFPVILIFGLLLAAADPTFADWRDAISHLLTSWAFLPRTIFFIGMLGIVLGAYGYAERATGPDLQDFLPPSSTDRNLWLGSTERLILIAGVALLFWTFLAVQLSYFFGNLPGIPGSGMTFAEYARRGFAEITVVASATVLLIVVAERYGSVDTRRGLIRSLTLVVVLAVLFLLGSAFHRVLLYEEAYGFTTARLYAQAYMIVVAVSLFALSRELMTDLDPSRLFRFTGVAAIIAFMVLVYWNHEAWIADRNIDLYTATGKLDAVYLTRDLSADAIPTLVSRLQSLPEPGKSQLQGALKLRYKRLHEDRWFEWNVGRSRARAASGGL